jgi:mRNA interferase RelE/StbE
MYKLRVPNHLVELIRDLHPKIKIKIRGSLTTLVNDSDVGIRLKDEMEDLRSFKVKRLRIIYRFTRQEEIHIIAIGPREQIYEDTFRLILKEREGSG